MLTILCICMCMYHLVQNIFVRSNLYFLRAFLNISTVKVLHLFLMYIIYIYFFLYDIFFYICTRYIIVAYCIWIYTIWVPFYVVKKCQNIWNKVCYVFESVFWQIVSMTILTAFIFSASQILIFFRTKLNSKTRMEFRMQSY